MECCFFCKHEEHEDGWQSHALWCPEFVQNGPGTSDEFFSGYDSGCRMEKYPVDASEATQKGWIRGYNAAKSLLEI